MLSPTVDLYSDRYFNAYEEASNSTPEVLPLHIRCALSGTILPVNQVLIWVRLLVSVMCSSGSRSTWYTARFSSQTESPKFYVAGTFRLLRSLEKNGSILSPVLIAENAVLQELIVSYFHESVILKGRSDDKILPLNSYIVTIAGHTVFVISLLSLHERDNF